MATYFVRRLLIAVPVLIGITMAGFFVLAAAPGDPYWPDSNPRCARA